MADRLDVLYPAHIAAIKRRHDAALAATGFDAVVIFSGAIHIAFLDDEMYPFKPNPHFKSWVPVVNNPHCFIVYAPGQRPRLVFFQPIDYWYKPPDTPSGGWTEHFDVRIIREPREARQHFPSGHVAYVGEAHEDFGPDVNPKTLLDLLHWERAWKSDYEIECIALANAKAVSGHRAAERAFRAGAAEYDIHIDYLRASTQTEEELPYHNIIALNEHASVLHYVNHDRDAVDRTRRHSFLIDAGASVNGYAADITRTYADGDGEFRELIAAMDDAQQSLCAAVKPGLPYPEIHTLAHRRVAELLVRFKFVKGIDADGVVETQLSSTFLPHGVGHYLGLQVHDIGGHMADAHGNTVTPPKEHPFLRLTRPIEPRNVFTIEPGFYFIDPLLAELQKSEHAKYVDWPRVDGFRKYGGVRIEDDLAVTETGARNLTREAFAG
ncbi:MAG TPA: Xaa-Pro dipeptidase [Thermoanaerobaculia bacterium]|nr:Xaa-Pro dipeptidase [Thermoanaerobaculia bacterium]